MVVSGERRGIKTTTKTRGMQNKLQILARIRMCAAATSALLVRFTESFLYTIPYVYKQRISGVKNASLPLEKVYISASNFYFIFHFPSMNLKQRLHRSNKKIKNKKSWKQVKQNEPRGSPKY